MKRLSAFLLFAFLASLVLTIPAPAADLQEGWYVRVSSVHIWQYDQLNDPFIRDEGDFYDTPPGQYGPFQVSDGTYHSTIDRWVSVPSAISAGPGDSLVMPLTFGMTLGEPIAYLGFYWETNYDPSQMRLEFWQENYYTSVQELLWAQTLSSYRYGGATPLTDATYEGQFFVKIAVIPEPSSMIIFSAGLGILSALRRRRT
ncbi:MAG TPA: PEP-CTERM sorting domain-containing protein [Armatimonadota bacterium]|nr:PEP-CTERM sorting domain-containing protein [Armatimonadota bacterium]